MKALAVVVLAVIGGCYDPGHEDAVANLGPDLLGPGARHRPGQPCTTCHGGAGPAELELSVAGTVYAVRGSDAPLVDAMVTITDARGESRRAFSNGGGNFYFTKGEWDPEFPLRVVVEAEGVRRQMATSIGRDGSCGGCHRGAGDRSYMPGVYVRER